MNKFVKLIFQNWDAFGAAKISSYIIWHTSMDFNVFIFCYIGEILTEQVMYFQIKIIFSDSRNCSNLF